MTGGCEIELAVENLKEHLAFYWFYMDGASLWTVPKEVYVILLRGSISRFISVFCSLQRNGWPSELTGMCVIIVLK
jgi:hypothetical protein